MSAITVGVAVVGGAAVVLAPIVFAAVAFLAVLWAAVAYPAAGYAVLGVLSSLPLVVQQGAPVAVALGGWIVLMIAVGALGHARTRGSPTPTLLALLSGYLLISMVLTSLPRAPTFGLGAVAATTLLPYMLPFGMSRLGAATPRLLTAFLSIGVALATLHVLTSPAIQILVGGPFVGVAEALNQNRNTVGAIYVLGLATSLPRIGGRLNGSQVLLILGSAALTVATAVSLSRASYLGGMALLLMFVLLRGRRVGSVLAVASLILAAGFLAGDSSALNVAIDRAGGTVSTGGLDTSSAARLDLWVAAWRAFEGHPLFGIGFQNFAPHLQSLWSGSMSNLAVVVQTPTFAYAHNLYLTVLSQGGVIGAFLLVGCAASLGRDALRAARIERETGLLALTAMGVVSLFGEPLFVAAVAVPFLLINAAARQSRISS